MNFADHDPIPEPPSMRDRFDQLVAILEVQAASLGALERQLRDQGRVLAFILASATKQPAQLTELQALLDRLGREMPGAILPASGVIGS